MILKRIIFSTTESNKKKVNDAELMKTTGKIALGAGAALGIGAGVELGKGGIQMLKARKDLEDLKKLKDNKVVRGFVKDQIKQHAPIGTSDTIINKIKWSEEHAPKFGKIDKIEKGLGLWNKSSKVSRTILDNAEGWTREGVESFKKKHGSKMTAEELKTLDKAGDAVSKLSKAGLGLKNAKKLGKAAKWAAGVGGLLYLNGRALDGSEKDSKNLAITGKGI